MTCRVFIDGDYNEPPPHMIPPTPMVEEINDCRCVIMWPNPWRHRWRHGGHLCMPWASYVQPTTASAPPLLPSPRPGRIEGSYYPYNISLVSFESGRMFSSGCRSQFYVSTGLQLYCATVRQAVHCATLTLNFDLSSSEIISPAIPPEGNVRANFGFFGPIYCPVKSPHGTDGRTDGRARAVMRPIIGRPHDK